MKRKKTILTIQLLALVTGIFAFVAYLFIDINIVGLISLSVALVALTISFKTFYSIDEVNAISRMDGNIMESPNYQPNLFSVVLNYTDSDYKQAGLKIMEHMEDLFKKGNVQSGAHLADSVQEVADMMIFVPFIIRVNEDDNLLADKYQKTIKNLIVTINCRVKEYEAISDGSCKLLIETLKLVEYVFYYQLKSANEKADPSKLLDIRGSLFVNPVSIILYNNYLGLYYLQKAIGLLDPENKKRPLGESTEYIISNRDKINDDTKNLAISYLETAVRLFKKALENVGEDSIWCAFICFNMSRALFQLTILGVHTFEDWEKIINESIFNWHISNLTVKDILKAKYHDPKDTWLLIAQKSQEDKVKLTKIIFQITTGKPLTDHQGNILVDNYPDILLKDYFKNTSDKDPLRRTDKLKEEITKRLS